MNQICRLILNGKSAGRPDVREAVNALRKEGHQIEVRVTWEDGDAARYAQNAGEDDIASVIAAGGDGTVNEVLNGLMQNGDATLPALLPSITPRSVLVVRSPWDAWTSLSWLSSAWIFCTF